MRSNPFGGGSNLSNEEAVETEIRNDNTKTVSLFINYFNFVSSQFL
jgi:hypothetical protein